MPGARKADSYRRGEVVVSWSIENVGYNLPTLVSTLQGNLYELREFSGLKLMDFDVPRVVRERLRGPRFGIDGTRGSPASGPADHRHDHQAERRHVAGADGRRSSRRSPRPASISSRTTS
jgi:hypothetical protein